MRAMKLLLCAALVLTASVSARGEHMVIADTTRVQDAALLSGAFGDWNFGGGPLLEAGKMVGIYAEHYAASVIRFDLNGVNARDIRSAKLRLYKPLSFVQLSDVPISVQEIPRERGGWREGDAIADRADAITANRFGYEEAITPLDIQTAPAEQGVWMEFQLPPALVQRWIERPAENHGLYVASAKPMFSWGDHVYFHASEHFYGKGPQLVIEAAKIELEDRGEKKHTMYVLPPQNEAFDAWMKSRKRLAGFTRHGEMSRDQAQLFYFYDTVVRRELILKRYQLPLLETFNRIETLLEQKDEQQVREALDEVHRLLLVWEYIRETSWYTSGPLADVLTPRQLGVLFGRSIFGRMEQRAGEEDKTIWRVVPPQDFEAHVDRTMGDMRNRLQLTPQQMALLRPKIAEFERLENEYLARFRQNLSRVQEMIGSPRVPDAQMLAEVRQLHLNHEAFLYYQSIYNVPRWSLWMEHVEPMPLARWVVDARRKHYEAAARGGED